MTKREELIEKVARAIATWDQVDEDSDRDYYEGMATAAIDTIYAAMQEPSNHMTACGMDSIDMPFYDVIERVYKAMITASPLAPEVNK